VEERRRKVSGKRIVLGCCQVQLLPLVHTTCADSLFLGSAQNPTSSNLYHDNGAHESGRISVINMNMPVGTPSVHNNSKVMYSLRALNSPFDPPPLLHTFLTRPVKTFVRLLDYSLALLRRTPKPDSPPIRIVCISDTHCLRSVHIPDGDLLIHAGDLTNAGTPAELQAQIDWLDSLPHQHKVAIAGNHDTYLDPRSRTTLTAEQREGSIDWKGIHYLQHSALTLKFDNRRRSLNLYGAPQIPACGGEPLPSSTLAVMMLGPTLSLKKPTC